MPSNIRKAGLNKSPAAERRTNQRFPLTASIEVTEPKAGLRISARTTDLGLGGCYVDSINPFPVGTAVMVRITKGQEIFEVQGQVVYSQIGMGMGISFSSPPEKQARLFQKWISEISGGAAILPVVPEPSRPLAPPQEAPASASEETKYVLNELLLTLIRKGILTQAEGNEMLMKLLR